MLTSCTRRPIANSMYAYMDSPHFFFHYRLLQSGHGMSEIKLASMKAMRARQLRMLTIEELQNQIWRLAASKRRRASSSNCSFGFPTRDSIEIQQPNNIFADPSQPIPILSPTPVSSSSIRQRLPPSPIVGRRTRNVENIVPTRNRPHSLAHLRFPSVEKTILSPRIAPRKRQVEDRCDDANHDDDDPLSSHLYRSTPNKRLCSPQKTGVTPPSSPLVPSPVRKGYSPIRLPPRERSPVPDKQPLVPPRRVASPPPCALFAPRTPPRTL